MFMDVEHADGQAGIMPGARVEGVGSGHCHWDTTGTWGFDLVSSSAHARVMKHDVRLRAGGRTRIWHVDMALQGGGPRGKQLIEP